MTPILHRTLAGTAARLLSVARSGRLSILAFHHIPPEPTGYPADDPDAATFEALMTVLRDGFSPLPLDEAARRLGAGTLPPRAFCVTFDDGYADNLTVAWPILQRLGIPATVFVATGYLDGGIMWNDRVIAAVRSCPGEHLDLSDLGLGVYALGDRAQRARLTETVLGSIKYRPVPEREALAREIGARYAPHLTSPMLTRAQLKELHAAGMAIGGHTVTHPILAETDDAQARAEMAANKEELEGLLGERLRVFAYPNGKPGVDFLPIHSDMARDLGYEAAVTTQRGVSTPATDPFRLRRFSPWERTPLRFGLRLLLNMRQAD